ncbi:unnamed protein product [Strongylus vulgaris]|uniref:Uncharacterized protein n=1 Tax=Strongylus vulgaris TaxID=40348 RepID=A0A3P7J1F8_STRVU|nr:unnamed protein product [Strongylus vulgaris]
MAWYSLSYIPYARRCRLETLKTNSNFSDMLTASYEGFGNIFYIVIRFGVGIGYCSKGNVIFI